MSTTIRFPSGPITDSTGMVSLEWQQWLLNPQLISLDLGSAVSVGSGGTGLTSGTSGGILAFTASDTLASSAELGNHKLVLGGGAGSVPSTPVGLGTSTTLLHGNATGAPTWASVVLTTDVSGTLPITNGGTNSATALSGSSIVISNGSAIVQGTAGTTTTVLHGNASGAPTYAAVSLTADVTGTLPAANGGTGIASYAIGDLVYASGATTLSKLADVATGNAVISGGVGVAPSWGKIALTTHVSGILPLANGGSNAALVASNGGVVYSDAAAFAINTPGSSGNWLKSAGAAAPVWTAPAALTKADDTNVTLTLGGSASTALLNAASITAGWTGTLAAARLNSNVVQAITNDTNVTGTIAAQTMTLGWTGQLSVARGGSGAGTLTNHGVLLGQGTSAIAATSAGSSGQILQSAGASADPAWSTATYPATAGSAGNVPRSNGTNFVATTLASTDLSDVTASTIASTFTSDGTGPGTSASVTITYAKVGNFLNINIPAFSAGSGTGTPRSYSSNTALPAGVRPAADQYVQSAVILNNGAVVTTPGLIRVSTGGTIFLYRDAAPTAYTVSSTCGLNNALTVTIFLA